VEVFESAGDEIRKDRREDRDGRLESQHMLAWNVRIVNLCLLYSDSNQERFEMTFYSSGEYERNLYASAANRTLAIWGAAIPLRSIRSGSRIQFHSENIHTRCIHYPRCSGVLRLQDTRHLGISHSLQLR
jgi:hypothetical protein